MIFTEFRFLLFFAVVFAVHWALRGHRARKGWLLACSYVFYGAWDWRFLSLILFSTVVDYVVGLRLGATDDGRARLRWLRLSLVCNLGLLGVFKYFNFFVDSGADLARLLGLEVPEVVFEIGLPVGISFYTFQTLSYSIDVYKRRLQPTRDLLDLALFVAFFPQLVAGPIVRAVDFLPQLVSPRHLRRIDFRGCLVLFLVGFVKKAVVSDGISPYVDDYWAHVGEHGIGSAYVGVMLYAAQIYCDFSAYSDMAIACAGLLGYNLCLNFDFPYFSSSVAEFWTRWHISLSTWLRDYLFIPLGGYGGSTLRIWRTVAVTWLLAGLWHGASWNFVIFGGIMVPPLIVQWHWRKTGLGRRLPIPRPAGVVLTMWWIGLSLIFFRSPDLATALDICEAYLLLRAPGDAFVGGHLVALLAVLAAAHWTASRRWLTGLWDRLPTWGFTTSYAVVSASVLTMINPTAQPFIYFQF